MPPQSDEPSESTAGPIFILAWNDRDDLAATRALLTEERFDSMVFDGIESLCDALASRRVGCILLSEQTATEAACNRLASCLATQPAWSDVPVVLLAHRDADTSAVVACAEEKLSNLLIVERPGGRLSVLSAIRALTRARLRQQRARDHSAAQDSTVDSLAVAAHRLDEQAQILDAITSATPDLLSIFDVSGKIVYANAQLVTLWKRTSLEQIRGLTMLDVGMPAEHYERRLKDFARIASTGKSEFSEATVPGPDGSPRNYETTFIPIFDASKRVEAIAGTTRDVTEYRRRRDRDALIIRLEEELRVLTDAEAITLASARLLGEHLQVDRCAYADVEEDQNTFNLTGDFCRPGVGSIVGRFKFTDFGDEVHQMMLRGETYITEDVFTEPKAGGRLDAYHATSIRAVICTSLLKGGKFVAAMAVHSTTPRVWRPDEVELLRLVASRCWESIERGRVARELAASEQRLRMSLQTGKLGVWEVDLRTMEMTCSDTFKTNYGRPADQPFTYEDLWTFVHPDDVERVQANLQRAIERRTDYNVEYRVRVGEDVRWVLVRGRAIYVGSTGVAARMVGVSVDITDRKVQEERRAEMLEAEQSLRVAAEAASQLKDEFLATLSHELRTPLSAILGWSQILRRAPQQTPMPPALAEGLAAIERNARAQTQIIEDLLDMSRIISGKVSLEARPIDLSAVVSAALDTVKPTSVAKEVEIQFIDSGLPMIILGDPNRLQQVFWNLLTNAVKFTPRGGKVRVEAVLEQPGGDARWRVDVADSGEGIRADFLPHVFDRFRQADASTTRRHGGLGLGLSIVKQLVELHGGTVGVTSDGPGRGATFSTWLPVLSISRNHEEDDGSTDIDRGTTRRQQLPSRLEASENASASLKLTGLRVLIVDDEPDARAMLRQVLEGCDVVVFDAPSAAAALALLEREPVDVIVSDIGMPLEDGHALIHSIRALSPLPCASIPAVALTAYARAEDRAKALAAGFNLHVAKPVEPSDLLDAVAQLTKQAVRLRDR